MGKRVRDDGNGSSRKRRSIPKPLNTAVAATNINRLQIVLGSYEHVLQGLLVTIRSLQKQVSGDGESEVEHIRDPSCQFADLFLVNAHTASIRSLAVSPEYTTGDKTGKRILATGGSDERINLYSLSTTLPTYSPSKFPSPQTPEPVVDSRELGSLLHHSAPITALHFPNKSKLISASEDNTIAISRTLDWTVLTSIKTPRRKAIGQASGDTSTASDLISGTNDLAVHPSSKLMISVGRGERCMRLWDLVTGRKAGALNFDKSILRAAGEARYSSGEGRKITWNSDGTEFAVAFERGIVVFGLDCQPRCRLVLPRPVKIHQVRYVREHMVGRRQSDAESVDLLAFSTEDGRIYFADPSDIVDELDHGVDPPPQSESKEPKTIAECRILASIGGTEDGVRSRIKDFVVLADGITVAGCSDGRVCVWHVVLAKKQPSSGDGLPADTRLLGHYDTELRITCLAGFSMSDQSAAIDDNTE